MAILKYKNSAGEYVAISNYTVQPIVPVQTTGSSTTDIMSQNAVTTALSEKADSSNVYTKTESDAKYLTITSASTTYATAESVTTLSATVDTKANASDVYTKTESDTAYATASSVTTLSETVTTIENKIPSTSTGDIVTTDSLSTTLESYQTKLTAGTGIEITDANVINVTLDTDLYIIVSTLPTSDIQTNKIYLLLSETSGEQNLYVEYMYVNNAWEKVGEYKADVDLSGYLTIDAATSTYATQDSLSTLSNTVNTKANSSDVYTKTETDNTFLTQTSASSTYALASDVETLETTLSGHTTSITTLQEYMNYNTGHNSVTTVASNIPTTKRLVIATISTSETLQSTAPSIADGYEMHLVLSNTSTSDVTITIPSSYVSLIGDTLTVTASSYAEINLLSDGTNIYLRGV